MSLKSHANTFCPVTGRKQNFSINREEDFIIIHDDHVHTSEEWVPCGTSSNGSPMYKRGDGKGQTGEGWQRPEPEAIPVASLDLRDAVYRAMIAHLGISEPHKALLESRNVPQLLQTLPFSSLPPERGERWILIKKLLETFTRDQLRTVPGFYEDAQGRLQIAGDGGILVPSLSAEQKVQAFQVRRDKKDADKPRYVWLSCGWMSEDGLRLIGTSSGSPTGILLPDGWSGEIALTEGAIKGACLKAHLPPATAVLYAAGVAQISSIQQALSTLPKKPTKISLYFDADAWRNRHVFGALVRQIRAFEAQAIRVEVVSWEEEKGKGIDDFLTNTEKPQTLSDTVKIDAEGLCAAYDKQQDKAPLHLFGTSRETMDALSLGIPAVHVPDFSPSDKALDKLKFRLEQQGAPEVFFYVDAGKREQAMALARNLIHRELEVRLTFGGPLHSYLETFEDDAQPLAIAEAREGVRAKNIGQVNRIVGRIRVACEGKEVGLVAQAIETLKDTCPLVKGEVLKAIRSELRPAPLAESEVARMFIHNHGDRLRFDTKLKGWMVYEGDAWRTAEDEEVLEHVANYVEEVRPKHAAGFVTGVFKKISWHLRRAEWNDNRDLIPLANGVLDLSMYRAGVKDLKRLTLKPHDPADGLTWKLPFAFDPSADCPKIKAWMKRATSILQPNGEWRESEEYQNKMLAAIAATLRGMGHELQMFFSIVGVPGTGKGTFFRLVEAFIGQKNVFLTTLEKFETSRFESAGIVGRRLMLVADSDNYRGSCERTRSLTGGDRIGVERKGIQPDAEGYRPNVMVFIASNQPIQFQDSDAMERRRVSVRLDHKVEPHEQNPNLDKELQEELPGLLNWALSLSEQEIFDILKKDGADSKNLRRQTLEEKAMGMFVANCLAVDLHGKIRIGDAKRSTSDDFKETGLLYQRADEDLFPAYRHFYESTYGSKAETSVIRFNRDLASFLHAALSLPPNLFFKDAKHTRTGTYWNGITLRSGSRDERPSPFDVSPTVGDPTLLEKLKNPPPSDPTPGGNGGGDEDVTPAQEPQVSPQEVAKKQQRFASELLIVPNYTPSQGAVEVGKDNLLLKEICDAVWSQLDLSKATQAIHRNRSLATLSKEDVAWVWQGCRDAYLAGFTSYQQVPTDEALQVEADF